MAEAVTVVVAVVVPAVAEEHMVAVAEAVPAVEAAVAEDKILNFLSSFIWA